MGFVIKNHDGFEANEANEADIDINKEKEIKKEIEKEKNKTTAPLRALGKRRNRAVKFLALTPLSAQNAWYNVSVKSYSSTNTLTELFLTVAFKTSPSSAISCVSGRIFTVLP